MSEANIRALQQLRWHDFEESVVLAQAHLRETRPGVAWTALTLDEQAEHILSAHPWVRAGRLCSPRPDAQPSMQASRPSHNPFVWFWRRITGLGPPCDDPTDDVFIPPAHAPGVEDLRSVIESEFMRSLDESRPPVLDGHRLRWGEIASVGTPFLGHPAYQDKHADARCECGEFFFAESVADVEVQYGRHCEAIATPQEPEDPN